MTYRGRIKNGVVVLEGPAALPEGAEVEVQLVDRPEPRDPDRAPSPTLASRLAPFIGKLEGLPSDLSINHDHYLYGVPKRR